jgi:phosphohistidine swiveling domain-containing protein
LVNHTSDEWVSEFDTPTGPGTTWTAANIQEALPGQVTPMTWSVTSRVLNYGFARPAQRAGAYTPPPDPYVALFYGRAHLNVSALRAGAEAVPFNSPEAIDEHYLGRARDPNARPVRPSLRRLARYLPVLPRIAWLLMRSESEVRAVEALAAGRESEQARLDLDSMSAAQIVAYLTESLEVGREVAAVHIGISGAASASFEALGQLTRSWLDDSDGSLQARLLSGLSEMESARPARALWDLSRLALRSSEVRAALAAEDAAAARALLERSETPETQEFSAAYAAFVERFGHRSVLEGELSVPSWDEDPGAVFALLRTLIATGPEGDPMRAEERQRRQREEATAAALARLSPPRRLLFRLALSAAQKRVADRERTKSLLIRGSFTSRKLLLALGRRLSEAGLIDAVEDVFYLTLAEAEALSAGARLPARERVLRRRLEEARNRAVVLPESFAGRPRPLAVEPPSRERVLKGIAVSPGRVTGVARVILDPRDGGGLAPGEVLVAPVTDAGWTPLFLSAAAIVVDIGGPLSHGATVAREMGLPAVVNVKHGTRVIRSGQRVTVDGSAGTVRLED